MKKIFDFNWLKITIYFDEFGYINLIVKVSIFGLIRRTKQLVLDANDGFALIDSKDITGNQKSSQC